MDSSEANIKKTKIKEWPGAFGVYKNSAAAVRLNLWTILGLLGFAIATSILADIISTESAPQVLAVIVLNIFSIVVSVGLVIATIASAKGKKISIDESLRAAFSRLAINYFLLSIATFVALALSLVALIIPFFFVLPRLLLAPYYLVDKNLGPIDALKASWEETKGHSGKVWGIIGVTLLMALGIFILIGIYFLVMYAAVMAVLYLFVTNQQVLEAK